MLLLVALKGKESQMKIKAKRYFFIVKIRSVTSQKMKFFLKDFFSKCDQIRSNADSVTFTEEILNGKLHFL